MHSLAALKGWRRGVWAEGACAPGAGRAVLRGGEAAPSARKCGVWGAGRGQPPGGHEAETAAGRSGAGPAVAAGPGRRSVAASGAAALRDGPGRGGRSTETWRKAEGQKVSTARARAQRAVTEGRAGQTRQGGRWRAGLGEGELGGHGRVRPGLIGRPVQGVESLARVRVGEF